MTLNYILETTVCWLFFYLLYALWLSRETFFTTNRAYLIGTLLLGLLIPAIDFMPTSQPVIVQDVTIYLNEITITTETKPKPDATFQISEIPRLIYWTGLVVCLLRFLIGMGGILRLFIGSEIIQKENHTLVRTAREHAPFSFLHFFFVTKKMNFSEAEWQQITRHEEAHIRGVHTLDVLLVEVLAIVFWFNPLIYLYKHAVRNVHEYLADAAVIKTVPMAHYGRFLVRLALPGFRMANNFNHSQLKKRIIMMTKSQSPKFALAKYILFIPLAVLMLVVFSCKDDVQNLITEDVQNKEKRSILYDENDDVLGEYTLRKSTEEGEETRILFDKAEKITLACLKEFTRKMETEYEPETDPVKKAALKEKFRNELLKQARDAGVTFYRVGQGENGANTICSETEKKGNWREVADHMKERNDVEKQVSQVKKTTINSIVDPDVYTIVDEMPRFPDCENIDGTIEEKKKCAEQKMLQYIYTNITYPAAARDAGVQGMVVVSFIVETDGRITNAKILRSLGYETDEEVIRLVENMPNWTPGIHEGEAVRVKFNLPVRFKLEG